MLGRYVMFALPVIFIAFLDFKDRDRKWNGVSKVVSFTLVFFATIVLIGRLFGTADYLMLSHVSPDGNIFKIAPAITLSILALTVISSMYVRKWYPMLVVIFYLVCAFYAKDINNSQLFKQEALIAKHINKDEGDISIYIDHSYSISDSIFRFKSNSKSIELTRYLRFWNIKNKLHIGTFIIDTTGKTKGFVLTSRLIPLETPIDSIVIKDEQQYLYKIPFNNLTKRIDLFSQMDSTNGNPVKTSQYENTMLSHERFGFIQSFLYDKGLITREVTYPDPFFFFNSAKSILTYEHEIIMTNNQNYMLQFEVDSSSQSSLNCQFGITKLAKTWNVSDGMHLTIKYYDELQGDILLAGQFIVPRLRDYVVSVPLPATRRKKFKLYFDTSSSGLHGNGDWLRINSLDIVSN
jgi:hypothetical protein